MDSRHWNLLVAFVVHFLQVLFILVSILWIGHAVPLSVHNSGVFSDIYWGVFFLWVAVASAFSGIGPSLVSAIATLALEWLLWVFLALGHGAGSIWLFVSFFLQLTVSASLSLLGILVTYSGRSMVRSCCGGTSEHRAWQWSPPLELMVYVLSTLISLPLSEWIWNGPWGLGDDPTPYRSTLMWVYFVVGLYLAGEVADFKGQSYSEDIQYGLITFSRFVRTLVMVISRTLASVEDTGYESMETRVRR